MQSDERWVHSLHSYKSSTPLALQSSSLKAEANNSTALLHGATVQSESSDLSIERVKKQEAAETKQKEQKLD